MAAISASHLPYWWTGRRKVHTLKWGGEVTKTCENCPLGQQTIYNPFGNKQSSLDSCSNSAEGTWNKWRYEDEAQNDPIGKNYKCVGCPGNQTIEFRGSSDPLDFIDCPAPPGKISWVKWEKTLNSYGYWSSGFYSRICHTCTNSVYNYGHKTCESCEEGYFSDDTKKCVYSPCPQNSVRVDTNYCECYRGFLRHDNGICTACESGTYKMGHGDSPYTLCGVGKFKTVDP